ncbi:ribonuclease P protein component [Patescibacteria group bacterium]|nr:ribonuclease P protein component [Patescibacteria group bacterium]MBU4511727.1 ribonuclease P protein component [Patescibacteria group bacterium]MCG2692834.1 ribonuclease P protein component [Candidatus Parcubacteria bacterium]
MLAKKYRLTRQNDFDKVFKNGRSFFNKEVGVKYANNDLDYSRFGFVVSNKISKKATERNKIKRRLREVIRLDFPKIKKGVDTVVVARTGIGELGYKEIEERVITCLKRLRLLN